MRAIHILLGITVIGGLGASGLAEEYHVAPGGDDANRGAEATPLRTIGRAAELMRPGDTCVVHAGVYREAVRLRRGGEPGAPMRFLAAPGERVTWSGLDSPALTWRPYRGSIRQARLDRRVVQLFVDGRLMTEARWPNMSMERLWDRSRWARAGKGSRYGKMVDPALARTGVDWTGAVATLNVAHQFFTWTRTVKHHSAGDNAFQYEQDLSGITHFADKTSPWEDDRYYLSGKLEALDSPGEWFYDRQAKSLYLWPLDDDDPTNHRVEIKTRNYAVAAEGIQHVELTGFHLVGCTFRFVNCDHVVIDRCRVIYPNAVRRISDPEADAFDLAETAIRGDDNSVLRSSFAYGPTSALAISGRRNRVEDCLMHDFCWDGSLRHPLLATSSSGEKPAEDRCVVRQCTLYNAGNAIINYRGLPGHIIELNHVHNGGLACKDVALVYTGSPKCAGSVVRYNWVHGCRTESVFRVGGGEIPGGLGVRGDDQTRSLTVHHNVVWDCGLAGVLVKGDNNRVANNTIFNIGSPKTLGNFVDLHTAPEPKKWWREQYPLLAVQNAHSRIVNNVARTITGDNKGRPYSFAQNMADNFTGDQPLLADAERFQFWPRDGSPLIDAGKHLPGLTDGFHGDAPDIGAYEHGGPRWIPGITWDPQKVLGFTPKGFLKIRS